MVTARVARAVGAALALMAAWPDAPARAESGGSRAAFAQADRERMEASAILARAAQALDAATAAVGARRAEAHEVDTAREDAAVLLQAQRAAMATALAVTGGKPGDARAQLVIAQLIRTAATTAGTLAALGGRRSSLGRQLREAASAAMRARDGRAHAEALHAAAGARWRRALRGVARGLVPTGAAALQVERPALRALAPWEIAASPGLRDLSRDRAMCKRTTGEELALDARLLRAASPRAGAKRRLQPTRVPSAEPMLPIAGTLQDARADPLVSRGGLVIRTSVSQTVSAPAGGTVVFARRFRDLGPLLIIDHGGGYHVVLVGLTRLDVHEAARLVAGQSVGRIEARSDEPASLHMQLRYRGMPIDPAAWPRAHQDKVAS